EQASGIEQVNQAITQMDEVTQQNAALVEEAAAAAESMQDQAARLTSVVATFRLNAAAHAAVSLAPAPRGETAIAARPAAKALPAKSIQPSKPIAAPVRAAAPIKN